MREEVTQRTKNLKILFAITKSPKLSDLVFQAERKRIEAKKLQEMQDDAILTLRQYRLFDGENIGKFVDNVHKEVFGLINDKRRSVSPPASMLKFASPKCKTPLDRNIDHKNFVTNKLNSMPDDPEMTLNTRYPDEKRTGMSLQTGQRRKKFQIMSPPSCSPTTLSFETGKPFRPTTAQKSKAEQMQTCSPIMDPRGLLVAVQ